MARNHISLIQVGERTIAYKGVGVMFFQDGFPVSMSISELKNRGIETSILHVVDECLKNGWSSETVIRKLSDDFQDYQGEMNNLELINKFCSSSYEDQREMIFQYLFGSSSNDGIKGKNMMLTSFIKNNFKVELKYV